MNSLPAEIHEIITEGHLSLVKVKMAEDVFNSVVIDTPETVAYLRQGNRVNILFKESEVIIAKNFAGAISIRNRFPSTITFIEKGKLLSKLTLQYKQHAIMSIITTAAVEELGLEVNSEVVALVKTTEISLSPHD